MSGLKGVLRRLTSSSTQFHTFADNQGDTKAQDNTPVILRTSSKDEEQFDELRNNEAAFKAIASPTSSQLAIYQEKQRIALFKLITSKKHLFTAKEIARKVNAIIRNEEQRNIIIDKLLDQNRISESNSLILQFETAWRRELTSGYQPPSMISQLPAPAVAPTSKRATSHPEVDFLTGSPAPSSQTTPLTTLSLFEGLTLAPSSPSSDTCNDPNLPFRTNNTM